MKSLFLCLIALLFPLCSHARPISSASSKLDQVCQRLVSIDKLTTPDICHSVFLRDPQSRTVSDYQRLGLILVNITAKVLNESIAGMKHTLIRVHNNLTTGNIDALKGCIMTYEQAIPSVQVAGEAIKTHNYQVTQNAVAVAEYTDSKCEDDVKRDEDEKAAEYIWNYRSSFRPAANALAAMAQLLIETFG